jgi:uncharacterized damage-inducible protein DinB
MNDEDHFPSSLLGSNRKSVEKGRMMRLILVCLVLFISAFGDAQEHKAPNLRTLLLEQLRATHNRESEWFVPLNKAVAGMTPAQASWIDEHGSHSVGQLASHLVLWDREELRRFNGRDKLALDGKVDETFNKFDKQTWDATRSQLDSVMADWEQAVEAADDHKIALWASTIAYVGTHNAYHIGQIVSLRKLQGNWDSANGEW